MNETTTRVPQPRQADPSAPYDGPHEQLVVGVDGSAASIGALTWAFRHAAEHGGEVEVLTAWPVHAPVFVREVPGHFAEARWRAAQVQAQAVARAQALVEDLPPYRTRLDNADALDALVAAALRSDLVVLGSDRPDQPEEEPARPGPWVPLTVQVQRKAACPVLVIPDRLTAAVR